MEKSQMEEEDLKGLRTLNEEFVKTRMRLSDIIVTQSRLEKDKASLILDIENKASQLSQLQAGLETKYGRKNVNLETGVLSEV